MYTLKEILEKVVQNEISIAEAEKLVRMLAVAEVGNMARIDVNGDTERVYLK